jgi:hypothetical protein
MQEWAAQIQAEGRARVVDIGQAEKIAQHRIRLV